MDRGTRKTRGGGIKPSSGRDPSSFEIGRKVLCVSGGRRWTQGYTWKETNKKSEIILIIDYPSHVQCSIFESWYSDNKMWVNGFSSQ